MARLPARTKPSLVTRIAGTALLLVLALFASVAPAGAQTLSEAAAALVQKLPDGSYSDRAEVVTQLAATGESDLAPLLQALRDGDLYVVNADKRVVIAERKGSNYEISDPISGAALGEVGQRDAEKIKVNNSLRRTIDSAMGQLTLMSPDPANRRAAAENILKTADPETIDLIDAALAEEADPAIAAILNEARAVIVLRNDFPADEQLAAVATLKARGDRDALAVLTGVQGTASAEIRPAVDDAIGDIQDVLAIWAAGQNVWYGISLGSVLLLAAIGLAITFGVMGVINMAHGEIVMLGAYTTFVVQDAIRNNAPELFDYSLAIALPLAFLVTALVGIAIERGIIRWLYGRPLETLLATWGLSLILQQAVRTIFGPNNREVGNPSFMSGAFDLGQLSITWNRMWIVVFALAVFAILLAVLNRTPLGLQMRAVTQNRRMASSMGIRTPFVDALTFGLGSGIAGMAGVALSQIDNVSPNLGQGYIIDSFMVVVFGGVGNLWGTLVGALTLGVANKFLEPYAGAVLGKIVILVFIILFIQRRPRGLFALKGRAVEQ
ncbi:MAG: urea ABC transporter permease subunit UrtB [Hyphomicrobiaceae bacterium]|nr:urea ABC transporter permease subunit UrtB [Hyphomicrobiaceae bacterium]